MRGGLSFGRSDEKGRSVRSAFSIETEGHTSMEVKVETYVENTDGKRALINRAFLTLIGLGPDNRPAILPRLILKSEEDRKEWERAEIRRSLRRKQREEGFHFYGE